MHVIKITSHNGELGAHVPISRLWRGKQSPRQYYWVADGDSEWFRFSHALVGEEDGILDEIRDSGGRLAASGRELLHLAERAYQATSGVAASPPTLTRDLVVIWGEKAFVDVEEYELLEEQEKDNQSVFNEHRNDPGYDFARTEHAENALALFNTIHPELANAPEDSKPFELVAFPFYAACAFYSEATDDDAAREFEGGIRIAVWAQAKRTGCTEEEAKAVTEEVFATMAQIGIVKAQGENPSVVLSPEPSEEVLDWVSGATRKAEGAVKALALRLG